MIFILAMFIANSVLGITVYYGALSPLMNGYNYLKDLYPDLIFCSSITIGSLTILVGITFGILKYLKQKRNKLNNEEIKENKPVKPISLISIFLMGILFTGVELTTALPYFGCLTSLVSQNLGFIIILLLIFLYSFIYCLPLLIVYFAYVGFKNNKFIYKFETLISKVSIYILPFAFVLVGGMFIISIF